MFSKVNRLLAKNVSLSIHSKNLKKFVKGRGYVDTLFLFPSFWRVFCVHFQKQQLCGMEFGRALIHAWNSLPIWFLCSNSVYFSFCLSFRFAHLVNSALPPKIAGFSTKTPKYRHSTLFLVKKAMLVAEFNPRYLLNFAGFSRFFLAIKHFCRGECKAKRKITKVL